MFRLLYFQIKLLACSFVTCYTSIERNLACAFFFCDSQTTFGKYVLSQLKVDYTEAELRSVSEVSK